MVEKSSFSVENYPKERGTFRKTSCTLPIASTTISKANILSLSALTEAAGLTTLAEEGEDGSEPFSYKNYKKRL